MTKLSKDYVDGFMAGIDVCILCAEIIAKLAHLAPSKTDVADGMVAGMKEAKEKAAARFAETGDLS